MADLNGTAAGAAAGTLISPGLGTAIGAGIGVIGDLISNKQSYNQSVQLWKMQQEYNLPKNQIARLKEAGLNPNLVYGNGQVVGNTATQQAHSPQAMQLGKIDLAGRYAQLANLQAQNDLLNAQVRKTNEETTGQQLANDLTTEFGRLEHGAGLRLTEQNIKSAEAIQNNTEAQTALLKTQQVGQSILNSKSQLEFDAQSELYEVNIAKSIQEYLNLVSTGRNIDANTELAFQQSLTEPFKRMLNSHQAEMFDAMTQNFFQQINESKSRENLNIQEHKSRGIDLREKDWMHTSYGWQNIAAAAETYQLELEKLRYDIKNSRQHYLESKQNMDWQNINGALNVVSQSIGTVTGVYSTAGKVNLWNSQATRNRFVQGTQRRVQRGHTTTTDYGYDVLW